MALWRSALWAVALTAAALLLPAPARADHGTPLLDEGLVTYLAAAHSYWRGLPPSCIANGVTVIEVHAVLYNDPDPDVAARADQPGCRLSLDRSQWRAMSRAEACTVVVHEWGHLLGHGHVDNPFNVMTPFPTRAPRACVASDRRAISARPAARRARTCRARARRVARVHGERRSARRISCVLSQAR